MSTLVRYEAARQALQVASSVDEVKDIRDKAQAMAAYARQAKDTALVAWATEIKVRAERRAGEMLAEMRVNGSRADRSDNLKTGPKSHDATSGKTLEELGINKTQSSRWQKLAAVPEKQFEQAVAAAKEVAGEVTTAAVARMTLPKREQNKVLADPKPAPKPEPTPPKKPGPTTVPIEKFNALAEQYDEMASNYQVIADELATCEALRNSDPAKAMQLLREEIRQLKQRRDALMTDNAELKRQVGILRKQVERAERKVAK